MTTDIHTTPTTMRRPTTNDSGTPERSGMHADQHDPATTSGIWVDARGDHGPNVLLIAGLGDPAEAWALQLDHLAASHQVAAFDNRGAGRTALPAAAVTVASMADDAVEVMDTVGYDTAHVIGFSGGSVIAQELTLRHPGRVDSLTLVGTWARADRSFRAMFEAWRWMAEHAPTARAFYEAFFVWVYTPRAHESGLVDTLVDDALGSPHQQSLDAFHRQLDAFLAHDALDRLPRIEAPTLVVAGELDLVCPPRLGRTVANAIPGARFELLAGEAHQPFQESPERFHDLLHRFWDDIQPSPSSKMGP
jgi:pimeloyl-ACP methyl ester carboxylesterase